MDAPLQICRRFRYEHTFLYKYALEKRCKNITCFFIVVVYNIRVVKRGESLWNLMDIY